MKILEIWSLILFFFDGNINLTIVIVTQNISLTFFIQVLPFFHKTLVQRGVSFKLF